MKWKRINPEYPKNRDTRTCTKCMEVKPLSEFYKDKVNASGYRSWCKECIKKDNRILYHSHDGSSGKLNNARRIAAKRELKRQLVEAAGGKCTRCGYNKSVAALDFHHHTGEKESPIADLLLLALNKNGDGMKKALDEAAKCILLCANCHRELHWENGQ